MILLTVFIILLTATEAIDGCRGNGGQYICCDSSGNGNNCAKCTLQCTPASPTNGAACTKTNGDCTSVQDCTTAFSYVAAAD